MCAIGDCAGGEIHISHVSQAAEAAFEVMREDHLGFYAPDVLDALENLYLTILYRGVNDPVALKRATDRAEDVIKLAKGLPHD